MNHYKIIFVKDARAEYLDVIADGWKYNKDGDYFVFTANMKHVAVIPKNRIDCILTMEKENDYEVDNRNRTDEGCVVESN
jgi:hypothetical protein